ncbi:MAG: glycosyltransferase [Candidatus Contendobacter sp.]
MKLVAIILTLNEERHLARCLASVRAIASEIVVADCFSTDATLEIARAQGARVIQHEWVKAHIGF